MCSAAFNLRFTPRVARRRYWRMIRRDARLTLQRAFASITRNHLERTAAAAGILLFLAMAGIPMLNNPSGCSGGVIVAQSKRDELTMKDYVDMKDQASIDRLKLAEGATSANTDKIVELAKGQAAMQVSIESVRSTVNSMWWMLGSLFLVLLPVIVGPFFTPRRKGP